MKKQALPLKLANGYASSRQNLKQLSSVFTKQIFSSMIFNHKINLESEEDLNFNQSLNQSKTQFSRQITKPVELFVLTNELTWVSSDNESELLQQIFYKEIHVQMEVLQTYSQVVNRMISKLETMNLSMKKMNQKYRDQKSQCIYILDLERIQQKKKYFDI